MEYIFKKEGGWGAYSYAFPQKFPKNAGMKELPSWKRKSRTEEEVFLHQRTLHWKHLEGKFCPWGPTLSTIPCLLWQTRGFELLAGKGEGISLACQSYEWWRMESDPILRGCSACRRKMPSHGRKSKRRYALWVQKVILAQYNTLHLLLNFN